MNANIKGKKLLVIGSQSSDINIMNSAHEIGAYVIAVDGNTNYAMNPGKLVADEAWDIDYSDIDAVARKCIEAGVDGVMAGYSEFRVLSAAKVSEKIGKPFYATSEQIEITRSKRKFKDLCVKYGVPIAKDYCFSYPMTQEEKESVRFPVIVKPTDYAGCKGITVCYNSEQLEEAIEYAAKLSVSKTIIVEDYLIGTELMAIYTIVNGTATLSCLNEKYISQDHERISGLCDVVLTPSKYYEKYISETDGLMKGFLKGIHAQNGVAFFQFIANDDGITAFEMGYRLNGNNDYKIIQKYNDINYMNMLISYSLTGEMGDDNEKDDPEFGECNCSLLMYVHGGTIGSIHYEALKTDSRVVDIFSWITEGKTITEDGSTQQHALTFKLVTKNIDEMAELIKYVYSKVSVTDVEGNNMLFKPFDTRRLFKY